MCAIILTLPAKVIKVYCKDDRAPNEHIDGYFKYEREAENPGVSRIEVPTYGYSTTGENIRLYLI